MASRASPPAWTLDDRIAWVEAFARAVAARRNQLAALMHDEVGKSEYQAIGGDILPLLASCRWHARSARRLLSPARVTGTPLFMLGLAPRELRTPLAPHDGPARIAIIATWNYPVQLLGVQLVQAIVAGNRVIVKPSENAPRTQQLLLDIAQNPCPEHPRSTSTNSAHRLPPGVLEWTAATREAGRELLAQPDLAHVVFTGSTAVGRQIAAWAAERLVTTTLELSGSDSAFVLADADVRSAAAQLWDAVTLNAGQTCMAPRRVLVERAAYAPLLAALAPLAASAKPARLISAHAAQRCHELSRAAISQGGRSLSGVAEPPERDGRWWRPLLIADCPGLTSFTHEPRTALTAASPSPVASAPHAANMPHAAPPQPPGMADLLAGRHFGPLAAIVPVDSLDEAIAVHRACDQHLSASIFTRDVRRARELALHLGASQVCINSCLVPTGHPATSLGGRGPSGWGTSRGAHGLLEMTRPVFTSSLAPWAPRVSVADAPPRMLAALHRLIDLFYGRRAPANADSRRPPTATPIRQNPAHESPATPALSSPESFGGTRGAASPTIREPAAGGTQPELPAPPAAHTA